MLETAKIVLFVFIIYLLTSIGILAFLSNPDIVNYLIEYINT